METKNNLDQKKLQIIKYRLLELEQDNIVKKNLLRRWKKK